MKATDFGEWNPAHCETCRERTELAMEDRMTLLERHLWATLRLVVNAPIPAAAMLASKAIELDRVAGMLSGGWRDSVVDFETTPTGDE